MPTSLFRKHQTVTFKPKAAGPAVTGFLETLTDTHLEITFDNGKELRWIKSPRGMTTDTALAKLQVRAHTGTSIPSALQTHIDNTIQSASAPAIRKGDVVRYRHDGKTCTARVHKGGKQPTVIHSDHMMLGIPRIELSAIDLPQPDPELADWTVTNHTTHGVALDGYITTTIIARSGKPVIEVTDAGDGGPASVAPTKQGSPADIEALEAVLAAYLKKYHITVSDPIDLWANYAWNAQPRGITLAGQPHQHTGTPP